MNFYQNQTWNYMLSKYQNQNCDFNIQEYHKILCKNQPEFLQNYIKTFSMQRLKGIGLLCGTDWTELYKNRFYYSRFNHSVGVALIVWNFTQSKTQTLAALFHDIATPIFSHVEDFRKGDALTQTSTEKRTKEIILQDSELCELLKKDCIKIEEICDYHKYPIADNECPFLSADRLEYMFPSGAALQGSWTLPEIKKTYNDITILQNESENQELGFKTLDIAKNYCQKFLETSHILQLNENKLTLQLLATIMTKAIQLNLFTEDDFYNLTESDAITKLDDFCQKQKFNQNINESQKNLCNLYKTFRKMQKIEHTNFALEPKEKYFCVNLKVKQRYINPLVLDKNTGKSVRLNEILPESKKLIQDFLAYKDSDFGCVNIIDFLI